MSRSLTIPELCGKLTEYGSFLLFTHSRPDGDTLGSALALKRLIEGMGRTAEVVCADRIPQRLAFLTGQDDFGIERLSGTLPKCFISVDVADFELLGRYKSYGGKIDIAIDHHACRIEGNCFTYVDDTASACGEIIFEIGKELEEMGLSEIDRECAEYLYCAISSDTGGFAYSNVTPRTHRIVAQLLEYDIDHATLAEQIHLFTTRPQLEMQAEIIDEMRFYSFERIAAVYMTDEMRTAYGVKSGEDGDIVNLPRGIPTVEICFSVKESIPGEYRVSLRSKHVDISQVAKQFGGGGHIHAAGCSVKADDVEDCLNMIALRCTEVLEHDM